MDSFFLYENPDGSAVAKDGACLAGKSSEST